MKKVYCYGMISPSTVLVLKEGTSFPEANGYAEMEQILPSVGGEAANSAVVLAKFGITTVLDGTWINAKDEEHVRCILEPKGIDLSPVHITAEGGPHEYVIADGVTRTVFGNYADFHSGARQWNLPSEEHIQNADAVALDPYLRDCSTPAARYCVAHGTPYVTLDCRHDSYLAQNAAAVVISHECYGQEYRDVAIDEVFSLYVDSCSGLVIFTFGEDALWYARRGRKKQTFSPYKIKPLDTTGAGDSFRGAVVFGILKRWSDEQIVSFASAVAAQVCMTMPHALNVPAYEVISEFIDNYR